MAGKDWLTAAKLSIRKPEATSFSSTTSFNKTNVNEFFNKLDYLLDKYKFIASKIWNIDKTGVSTVSKPSKIVAAKGKHNVGLITSAERGTNVTIIILFIKWTTK